MIYLFENPGNNVSIVYDETTLSESDKAKGIAIEELPEKEETEGKYAILKCKKSTEEVWYEYEDIPKVPRDTDTEELSYQIEMQQTLLDDLLLNIIPELMMGGGM